MRKETKKNDDEEKKEKKKKKWLAPSTSSGGEGRMILYFSLHTLELIMKGGIHMRGVCCSSQQEELSRKVRLAYPLHE